MRYRKRRGNISLYINTPKPESDEQKPSPELNNTADKIVSDSKNRNSQRRLTRNHKQKSSFFKNEKLFRINSKNRILPNPKLANLNLANSYYNSKNRILNINREKFVEIFKNISSRNSPGKIFADIFIIDCKLYVYYYFSLDILTILF